MAAAYGIVQSHDGRIFIESIPDKGTKIDIYLPAFSPDSETGEGPAGKPEKFSKTALIIEDEETVREVCQGMLEKLGYRVMIAETGHKAVDIAKSSHTKIDIALLDIGLPDMEGKAIYPLIKEARPDIKTIVCSGFDLDGQAHEILKSGAEAFIQKPFTMDTLATKLSEVMD